MDKTRFMTAKSMAKIDQKLCNTAEMSQRLVKDCSNHYQTKFEKVRRLRPTSVVVDHRFGCKHSKIVCY